MRIKSKIGLICLASAIEKISMTIFNMSVALFLVELAGSSSLSVIGMVYMAIQIIPLGVLSVLLGIWLDNTERLGSVLRGLVVKLGCILVSYVLASFVIYSKQHIGLILTLPLLLVLVVITSVANSMHLVIAIALERIWIPVASTAEVDPLKFLNNCNSWMTVAQDVAQVAGLLTFRRVASGFMLNGTLAFLSVILLLCFAVQYVIFGNLNRNHLPQQVSCLNGTERTFKMSLEEFLRHRHAPLGICWALRSVFTASWLATVLLEDSTLGDIYKWILTVISISTSLLFLLRKPKVRMDILLVVIAGIEIVAVLLSSVPVLASKLSIESVFHGGLDDKDDMDIAYHTSTLSLNFISPKVFHAASLVVLALGLIAGASCQRAWHITILSLFQDSVPARTRGTIGGVQYFFGHIAIAFHGVLVLLSHGKEYVWISSTCGLVQSVMVLVVLVVWRKYQTRETVALLRPTTADPFDEAPGRFQDVSI